MFEVDVCLMFEVNCVGLCENASLPSQKLLLSRAEFGMEVFSLFDLTGISCVCLLINPKRDIGSL